MTYTDESKSEHFAGAFSLYITDPKTFSRLRPRPYAFFAARFPDRDRPARP